MRRRVERRRRARVFWFPQVLRHGVAVVACSSALIEVRVPYVAAAGHAERGEHELRHDVVQRFAFNLLDDVLQVNKTFTGVAEALAGSEVDGEGIAVTAPVAESGTVAEYDAGGDFREAIVAFDVGFGEIGGQRDVEAKVAVIVEVEDSVS